MREEAAHLVTTAEYEYPWTPARNCLRAADRHARRRAPRAPVARHRLAWRFILVQRNQVKRLITSPKSHQRRRVDMSSQLAATLLAWRRVERER
jgi:hypothetical protein